MIFPGLFNFLQIPWFFHAWNFYSRFSRFSMISRACGNPDLIKWQTMTGSFWLASHQGLLNHWNRTKLNFNQNVHAQVNNTVGYRKRLYAGGELCFSEEQTVGAQWLSGGVIDSWLAGCWLEPHPSGVTALCPWAWHINPCLVLVQPMMTRPNINEKIVDWDVKNQIKQTNKNKQGRPWSDCFFRSSLVWVCPVCLGFVAGSLYETLRRNCYSVCLVIFHAFVVVRWLFSKLHFSKNSFGNTIRLSNILVQDQVVVLAVLIWVENVCKSYQQDAKSKMVNFLKFRTIFSFCSQKTFDLGLACVSWLCGRQLVFVFLEHLSYLK